MRPESGLVNNGTPAVLITTLMRPHGTTGVQTHFREFGDYLDAVACPHSLLTPFTAPAWQIFPVFGLRRIVGVFSRSLDVWWYRHWHYVFLRSQLQQILRDGDPVTVYAQCPLSARAALQARSSPMQKVVLAIHFNRSQAWEWVEKRMIPAEGWLFRRITAVEKEVLATVDGIVFLSGFMKEYLEREGLVPAACPSLQIANFCHAPVAPDNQASLPQRDMVSIGTLEQRKNQAYLLHVLAAMKKFDLGYNLDLIGDGPDRSSLEALARKLDIASQVRFLGYQAQASRFLPGYRVYVHSATLENMPYTLIEALGSGLPVLAGAVGGIPEIFESGREGYFWPLDDPEEGARLAARILADTALHQQLSQQARQRFADHFAAEKVGARLQDFLTMVVSGDAAPKGKI